MKTLMSMIAACLLAAMMVACETDDAAAVSPGVMADNGACCAEKPGCCADKTAEASPGAVGEKSGCCADKCADKTAPASPGAVSDDCAGKSGCDEAKKACPFTGASPGAVSEKSGCCAGKKG